MRRPLECLLMLLIVSCASYETVRSDTYYGFSIGISNAPPPPRRVVYVERPTYVVVPGTSVYVCDDSRYDLFRYGRHYYLSSDGYWYRARHHRGPFIAVDVRRVPRAVLKVPGRHWKHHPHYAGGWDGDRDRRRGRDRDWDRYRDRDRDRD